MTWDPRFLCPVDGRAPVIKIPDFVPSLPVVQAKYELAALMVRDGDGGRLRPNTEQTCINGHTWRVPAAEKVEEA